jgi:transcriptional regulator with XRE-family HTH domain
MTADGARRRVQALLAFGYSERALAREAGVDPRTIRFLLRGCSPQEATLRKIAAVFDRLSLVPPASAGVPAWVVAASRDRSGSEPKPLDWDEAVIDDPAGTPVSAPQVDVLDAVDENLAERAWNGELYESAITKEALALAAGQFPDAMHARRALEKRLQRAGRFAAIRSRFPNEGDL